MTDDEMRSALRQWLVMALYGATILAVLWLAFGRTSPLRQVTGPMVGPATNRARWGLEVSEAMSENSNKKPYLVLPPELGDGDRHFIWGMDDSKENLGDLLTSWAEASEDGDEIEIRVAYMSPEQVAAIPEE